MRCFLLLILSLLSTTTYAADLTGQARIVDGDTIWIGGTKVRLHGIDAPEMSQECIGRDGSPYRCGKASTDSLRVLVGSEPVRCEGDTYDRYKRLIAVCYSGTVNLSAELVRQGWVPAYPASINASKSSSIGSLSPIFAMASMVFAK